MPIERRKTKDGRIALFEDRVFKGYEQPVIDISKDLPQGSPQMPAANANSQVQPDTTWVPAPPPNLRQELPKQALNMAVNAIPSAAGALGASFLGVPGFLGGSGLGAAAQKFIEAKLLGQKSDDPLADIFTNWGVNVAGEGVGQLASGALKFAFPSARQGVKETLAKKFLLKQGDMSAGTKDFLATEGIPYTGGQFSGANSPAKLAEQLFDPEGVKNVVLAQDKQLGGIVNSSLKKKLRAISGNVPTEIDPTSRARFSPIQEDVPSDALTLANIVKGEQKMGLAALKERENLEWNTLRSHFTPTNPPAKAPVVPTPAPKPMPTAGVTELRPFDAANFDKNDVTDVARAMYTLLPKGGEADPLGMIYKLRQNPLMQGVSKQTFDDAALALEKDRIYALAFDGSAYSHYQAGLITKNQKLIDEYYEKVQDPKGVSYIGIYRRPDSDFTPEALQKYTHKPYPASANAAATATPTPAIASAAAKPKLPDTIPGNSVRINNLQAAAKELEDKFTSQFGTKTARLIQPELNEEQKKSIEWLQNVVHAKATGEIPFEALLNLKRTTGSKGFKSTFPNVDEAAFRKLNSAIDADVYAAIDKLPGVRAKQARTSYERAKALTTRRNVLYKDTPELTSLLENPLSGIADVQKTLQDPVLLNRTIKSSNNPTRVKQALAIEFLSGIMDRNGATPGKIIDILENRTEGPIFRRLFDNPTEKQRLLSTFKAVQELPSTISSAGQANLALREGSAGVTISGGLLETAMSGKLAPAMASGMRTLGGVIGFKDLVKATLTNPEVARRLTLVGSTTPGSAASKRATRALLYTLRGARIALTTPDGHAVGNATIDENGQVVPEQVQPAQ